MIPIPILFVISLGGIILIAITVESLYVSIRNVCNKSNKSPLSTQDKCKSTFDNGAVEI
jgi:hypothetical protein